jgi:hypothetical protein
VAGKTRAEAAEAARNSTVDFNRRGEKAAAMNSLYAFFNASMQGNARLAEVDPVEARRAGGGRHRGHGFPGGRRMNRAMSDDDDKDGTNDYDAIPEFVKERNLVVALARAGSA